MSAVPPPAPGFAALVTDPDSSSLPSFFGGGAASLPALALAGALGLVGAFDEKLPVSSSSLRFRALAPEVPVSVAGAIFVASASGADFLGAVSSPLVVDVPSVSPIFLFR